MNDQEKWRAIPSQPEYMASSFGRIMRIPHLKPVPNGGVRSYGGIPTKGQWDGSRYIAVISGKTRKVHRLICEAFHGPPPPNKPVCMHLDECSSNNRPENLKWGTQKENLNAPGFLEHCRSRTGNDNPAIKGRRKKAA